MRVVVTGPTGFVGRAVLARLARDDHQATPLVRRFHGLPGEVVIGELGLSELDVHAFAGASAVIHLAARTHILNDRESDPRAAYRRVNVAGTNAVLSAAIAARVQRFVFVSSVKAAGERTAPDLPMTSASTPRPEDDYGITKLEAEALVRDRCQAAGIEWCILRPPLVYGPGVAANFERMMSAVSKGLPLPFGAIRNRRSIIYVHNLADAIVNACSAPGAAGEILMLADRTLSLPELLEAIASAQGRGLRLLPVPPALLRLIGKVMGRSGEVDRLCGSLEIDSSPSFAQLNWTPPIPFDAAIRATVAARLPSPPKETGNG